jgi:precorrin-6B methylase 2
MREFFNCRRFDYERRLLPHPYLAELEPDDVRDIRTAQMRTGLTIGYPSWCLLYFVLYSSLPLQRYERTPGLSPVKADPVVVETGTNQGVSTIVMATVLRDLGLSSRVQTVDHNEDVHSIARRNIEAADLTDYVDLHLGDSHDFLSGLGEIDFAFLDDNHDFEHVMAEFEIVRPKLLKGGTVYFDNTMRGGVAEALETIHKRYGGNVVNFPNCSAGPPGNAIWQP